MPFTPVSAVDWLVGSSKQSPSRIINSPFSISSPTAVISPDIQAGRLTCASMECESCQRRGGCQGHDRTIDITFSDPASFSAAQTQRTHRLKHLSELSHPIRAMFCSLHRISYSQEAEPGNQNSLFQQVVQSDLCIALEAQLSATRRDCVQLATSNHLCTIHRLLDLISGQVTHRLSTGVRWMTCPEQ